MRKDSASDFHNFHHSEPDVVWWNDENDHTALDSSSPTTSLTSVDVSDHVPPGATFAFFYLISFGDGTAAKQEIGIRHPDMKGYPGNRDGMGRAQDG